eukprot:1945150-Pyramimonas_sp.AAC.1
MTTPPAPSFLLSPSLAARRDSLMLSDTLALMIVAPSPAKARLEQLRQYRTNAAMLTMWKALPAAFEIP